MNKWKADNIWKMGRIYAASPTWAVRVDGFMNSIDAYAEKSEEAHEEKLLALSL